MTVAIGVYRPKTKENIGTLWRAAHLYGADFIFTIGHRYQYQCSDTTKAWRSIPLVNYPDFEAFQQSRPLGLPMVGVELSERAVPLGEYAHRKHALYLLGAEDGGIPKDVLAHCSDVVQIEAAQPWSMNVAMAGSLVLYSRHMQRERVSS